MHWPSLLIWEEFQQGLWYMVENESSVTCESQNNLVSLGADIYSAMQSETIYKDPRNEYSIPIMANHIKTCNSGKGHLNDLFGIVNVLWLLAWDVSTCKGQDQTKYLKLALDLLGERSRRNMDFLESSSWPIKSLHVVLALDNPSTPMWPLPKRRPIDQRDFILSTGIPQIRVEVETCTVWEIGVHAALSDEVTAMMTKCNVHKLIQNQYPSWRPKNASNSIADHLQQFFNRELFWSEFSADPIPHAFRGKFRSLLQNIIPPSLVICTLPILCYLFSGLGWLTLGYFGHPLLFMVSDEDRKGVIEWARNPDANFHFVVTDPFLAMQYEYLLGGIVPFIRTLALYTRVSWNPDRDDILVWERPHEVTLMCSIQMAMTQYADSRNLMSLSPERNTPVYSHSSSLMLAAEDPRMSTKFVSKSALSDRGYSQFAKFRAVVIFPYDMDLVAFYEFVQIGIPILIPNNLDKYFFFQNHARYDYGTYAGRAVNPFNESNAETTRHNLKFTDYFRFDNIAKFESLNQLVEIVHEHALLSPSFPDDEVTIISTFWNNTIVYFIHG